MHRSLRTIRPAIIFSALCCGMVAIGLFLSQDAPALAQEKTTKKPPAPDRLYNKTLEECEKILGKPALVVKNDRYYKSRFAGVTRIILGVGDSHLKKIDGVTYHFPKGTKTWQQALALIGVSSKGVEVTPFGESGGNFILDSIPGGFSGNWITAEGQKGMSGGIGPHPDDDSLELFKKTNPGMR